MASDCYVFKFFRRSVNGKYLMRFQSEKAWWFLLEVPYGKITLLNFILFCLVLFVKSQRLKLFFLSSGFILSAFYYGYLLTHLPGGYLARKLGGATVIGVAVGATGALTLFTPLAARMHVGTLIALRVAMGLAEVRKHARVMKNLLFNEKGLLFSPLFFLFSYRCHKSGFVWAIVYRGEWLWSPANIKGTNKDGKIYVGRSNRLFCLHTLCNSYATKTFLLISSSVSSKQLLCFVHGQGQKREQNRTTKNFVEFHNHSPLLTMFGPNTD